MGYITYTNKRMTLLPIYFCTDVLTLIFEFDPTYREHFTQRVIPELEEALQNHFLNIQRQFPGYVVGFKEALRVCHEHPFLKLTQVAYQEQDNKWVCNGGTYVQSGEYTTSLFRSGMISPEIPVPIPSNFLADFFYKNAYFISIESCEVT